jgi:hypothetical protein
LRFATPARLTNLAATRLPDDTSPSRQARPTRRIAPDGTAEVLLFTEARSANSFSDAPVTDEQLQAIFECGVLGGTTAAHSRTKTAPRHRSRSPARPQRRSRPHPAHAGARGAEPRAGCCGGRTSPSRNKRSARSSLRAVSASASPLDRQRAGSKATSRAGARRAKFGGPRTKLPFSSLAERPSKGSRAPLQWPSADGAKSRERRVPAAKLRSPTR